MINVKDHLILFWIKIDLKTPITIKKIISFSEIYCFIFFSKIIKKYLMIFIS
jgi:hypothetical protein